MRVLAVLVVILSLGWGVWWWVAAAAMERGSDAWFEARQAEGWQASHAGRTLNGFPNRLDLTLQSPELYDTRSGMGWAAPFVQIFALSYRPWHVIAAFAPEQRLILPGQPLLTLGSDRLQASLRVEPSPALTLDRVTLVGDGLSLRAEGGTEAVTLGTLRFATRQAPALADGHEIAFEALDIVPGADFARRAGLPAAIEALRIDMEVGFSAPLDRHAGVTRPAPVSLRLREARLVWGGMVLNGSGQIVADAQGRAEGRIDWRVENWPLALAAAQAAGLVSPEVAPTWANALSLLSQAGGVPGRIDLPLVLQGGRMSLGPLPLGPAPVFGR